MPLSLGVAPGVLTGGLFGDCGEGIDGEVHTFPGYAFKCFDTYCLDCCNGKLRDERVVRPNLNIGHEHTRLRQVSFDPMTLILDVETSKCNYVRVAASSGVISPRPRCSRPMASDRLPDKPDFIHDTIKSGPAIGAYLLVARLAGRT